MLVERAAEPTFRGCAFVNARAEGGRREDKVTRVGAATRAWLRGLFIELARDAGAADPDRLGGQLVLLYDGGTVGASMDADLGAAKTARAMAEALLDAQITRTSDEARRREEVAIRSSGPAADRESRPQGGESPSWAGPPDSARRRPRLRSRPCDAQGQADRATGSGFRRFWRWA